MQSSQPSSEQLLSPSTAPCHCLCQVDVCRPVCCVAFQEVALDEALYPLLDHGWQRHKSAGQLLRDLQTRTIAGAGEARPTISSLGQKDGPQLRNV